mmetsp:Transcript_10947/g.20104  ORF Transcript_10947/g.20104 Transcript_10947/m.20104 type:complete len:305 (+) Transcript_10947:76-990(+)
MRVHTLVFLSVLACVRGVEHRRRHHTRSHRMESLDKTAKSEGRICGSMQCPFHDGMCCGESFCCPPRTRCSDDHKLCLRVTHHHAENNNEDMQSSSIQNHTSGPSSQLHHHMQNMLLQQTKDYSSIPPPNHKYPPHAPLPLPIQVPRSSNLGGGTADVPPTSQLPNPTPLSQPPPPLQSHQIHRNSPQMPLFHHANAKFSTTTAISSNKNRKQQPPQMKKEKDNRGPIGRLNLNELSDPIVTRDLNKPCCQHCNFCKGCEPCGRWNAADAYSKGQGVIIADASLAKGDPPLSVQAANTMFKINV